jgi:protein MAK16
VTQVRWLCVVELEGVCAPARKCIHGRRSPSPTLTPSILPIKTKITQKQNFCRNEYNVSGLCNRSSCPLANSRYATIREVDGRLYLFMKTVERAHTPAKLWQRVRLARSYAQALAQVDSHLAHWPKFLVHKNKQRLTKITQYRIRARRLATSAGPTIVPVATKAETRERRREAKAATAAKLENSIESELLRRLKAGTYGDIYNFPAAAYDKVLDAAEAEAQAAADGGGGEGGGVEYLEGESEDDEEEWEDEEEGELELEGEEEGGDVAYLDDDEVDLSPSEDEEDEDEDDEEDEGGGGRRGGGGVGSSGRGRGADMEDLGGPPARRTAAARGVPAVRTPPAKAVAGGKRPRPVSKGGGGGGAAGGARRSGRGSGGSGGGGREVEVEVEREGGARARW